MKAGTSHCKPQLLNSAGITNNCSIGITIYNMATTTSNSFKKVENYCVDGGVSAENLQFLVQNFSGALYLCGDDSGCEGGVAALSSFKKAIVCPLDPNRPEYQAGNDNAEIAIKAYREFEEALDSLPAPTAVVCKTANRASAVLAAYKAVKGNWTRVQLLQYASTHELKFVGSAGLLGWVNLLIDTLNGKSALVFRQLFEKESSTYSYLLADRASGEAVLIDPVLETVSRDAQLVRELGLTLKYVLNTHVHADHITGSGELKALHPGCQSVLAAASTGRADVLLQPYERVCFGDWSLRAVPTPGHTAGCMSYVLSDLTRVFTGDALLIRGCGRTDFQGGSASQLYESVHNQLFNALPASCLVYPAHDYKGHTCSSIGEEKALNPRLTKSLSEFVGIMDSLNLPRPGKIDTAVPANLQCGTF